jgi:oxygen-dependent protoporphyrinogen oxidase
VSEVLILGGGISGLATAYFLSLRGIRSTIVEANARLGGLIHTEIIEGCQLEAGPDSYIAAKPAVTELAREIPALADKIIGSNDQSRRIFIVKDGQLVPMPHGMVMMVPADLASAFNSPIFGDDTKRRFEQEQLETPKARSQDISIAEFVLDHFDKTVLDYVTEPLLAGVYGGDARNLSVASVLPRFLDYERHYGSLIRAVQHEQISRKPGSLFLSFRNGMQTLTDALREQIRNWCKVQYGEAQSIERRGARGWRVRVNGAWIATERIVVALPAHRASPVLERIAPELASDLAQIPYSSAITVMLGYRREHFNHPLDGFGFLVPRIERRQVAACTWVNTKFPERIAEPYVVLRAFIVDRDAETLIPADDAEIIQTVRAEFSRLMGVYAEPAFHTAHRWPKSMPQYLVGHAERRERIRKRVAELDGIELVGNAYDGVGIPDCVRIAREVARDL